MVRHGFVAGLVAWRAGELQDEIKRGAWFVLDADPSLVLRKPEGLWEELVKSAEAGMAARVVEGCQDLKSAGQKMR